VRRDGFAKVPRVAAESAGILMHRLRDGRREFLLVHPGGPFWAKKDDAAWSIPKGLVAAGEDALAAALREFAEETGAMPEGDLVPLGNFRQPGGKIVTAFAVEGDLDAAAITSNTFTMEWPPKSGRVAEFPEVDRAGWFDAATTEVKLHKGQRPMLEALLKLLDT
jgi:predicted NUDIX family NTP pyrophosphohydrolase